jgi:hypothetical protein
LFNLNNKKQPLKYAAVFLYARKEKELLLSDHYGISKLQIEKPNCRINFQFELLVSGLLIIRKSLSNRNDITLNF